MNKSLFILLLLSAALLPAAPSLAQKSTSAPNAPKLRPPPARSAWVVTYKSDKPKERPAAPSQSGDGIMVGEAAFVASAEVTRRQYTIDGKLAKSVTRYSDGKTITGYIIDMFGIRERTDDPDDLVLDDLASPYFAASDFRTHFPGLQWVRPEYYKGVVEIENVPYHYFAEGLAPAAATAPGSEFDPPDFFNSAGAQGREAWITGNGLPHQSREGQITATYTFKPADEIEPIKVPEKFLAVARAFFDSLSRKDPAYSGNR